MANEESPISRYLELLTWQQRLLYLAASPWLPGIPAAGCSLYVGWLADDYRLSLVVFMFFMLVIALTALSMMLARTIYQVSRALQQPAEEADD